MRCLIAGGADLILIETIFDTLNAKAAIFALSKAFEEHGQKLSIMISGTITDASGRTLSGQTPATFWHSNNHARPFTVDLNCALGAAALHPHLAEFASVADMFICAYHNAGLPNAFGLYDEGPEVTAAQIEEFAAERLVNIAGGCCGTTPEHPHHGGNRRWFSPAPHQTGGGSMSRYLCLSGLEPFVLTPDIPFVHVDECTDVTGSAEFRKLITNRDCAAALDVARDQVENALRSSTSTWTWG